jgi:hypothetical protein
MIKQEKTLTDIVNPLESPKSEKHLEVKSH